MVVVVAVVVGIALMAGLVAFLTAVSDDDDDGRRERALGTGGSGGNGCLDSELPIIRSAATNDLDGVRAALDSEVAPDAEDDAGNTPLACAGPRGHVAVVSLLLDRGADPDGEARDGDTLVADAVRFCQAQVAEVLLHEGASVTRSGSGRSLLTQAVDLGDAEMVEVLLAAGAEPATVAATEAIDLFAAESTSPCPEATGNRRAAALLVLLEAGGAPDTVLARAVDLAGDPAAGPIVEAALGRGADPDRDAAGPVLAVAVAGSDEALVAQLLDAGADPDGPSSSAPPDGSGTTTTTEPVLGSLLCRSPLDPRRCDARSAMQLLASGRLDDESAPSGPDEWESDPRWRATSSPLVVAAWQGDAALVRLLLGRGADPAKAGAGGFGPLHAAAAGGRVEVVTLLLAARASEAPSDGPVPASDLAAAAGHRELADQLRASGR